MHARINDLLARQFDRTELDFPNGPLTHILSRWQNRDNDQDYIRKLIIKTARKIRLNAFNPKCRVATPDCKLYRMTPLKSFIRPHIHIDLQTFHSLLYNCGFGPPTQTDFRDHPPEAATWYWNVFDFKKMGIPNFEHFFPGHPPQNKCFEFSLHTDGVALTAHFSKPLLQEAPPLHPQGIHDLPGDTTWFVDPGQINSFTAMEGLSGIAGGATRLLKFSTAEFYEISGFNRTAESRHEQKRNDWLNPEVN